MSVWIAFVCFALAGWLTAASVADPRGGGPAWALALVFFAVAFIAFGFALALS
jgi:hypothetical protein